MKLQIEQTRTRLPPWPWWTYMAVGLWLAVVACTAALNHWFDCHIELCLAKAVTGYPCAACGTTRVILSLLQGHFAEAAARNPMVLAVLILVVALTLLRLIARRRVRVTTTARDRIVLWIIVIPLFLANWAYVIAIGN